MQTYKWQRAAGVLMSISSLPSPYGIGTLGKAAYDFADWLAKAGQVYWQVLPVGPTGLGDSPYQSFSAFAGNPYFIDLDILIKEGLIRKKDIKDIVWGDSEESTDYGKIYQNRFNILKIAFSASSHKNTPGYVKFCKEHAFWLDDYALYMALKEYFENKSWLDWDKDIRFRDATAIKKYKKLLDADISFWKFCQYKFFEQWNALKVYVNNLGIKIIGDIPLYMSLDSADVWANNHLFKMNEERRPTHVAGVPPDCFSEDGQLWGNPIYDWKAMKDDDYAWWRRRIEACESLYDIIRIDHFIGIVRYYEIRAGRKNAKIGRWRKGPGVELTNLIQEISKDSGIIAEDLGVIVPKVRKLIDRMGWPGMKILEFAFDGNTDNEYLPHNYRDSNYVLYGGTHDNDTIRGYVDKLSNKELKQIYEYLDVESIEDIPLAMIRCGYASIANTAIFQMQDILGLGGEARMNEPATVGHNWRWRLTKEQFKAADAAKLKKLAGIYGR